MECEFASRSHESQHCCRYQAVLEMASIMSHQGSLPELVHELSTRLQGVFPFDVINFALHDDKLDAMRLNLWEGADWSKTPLVLAREEVPSGWVWENQKPLVFTDLLEEKAYPKLADILRQRGIRSYCVLPLTTPRRRLGALGFGSVQPAVYREVDLEFLKGVAELVGLAVENSLTREALSEERNRLQALVEVNNTLIANLDIRQLFPRISAHLRQVVDHDFASVAVFDPKKQEMQAYVLVSSMPEVLSEGETIPLDQSVTASAFLMRETKKLGRQDLAKLRLPIAQRLLDAGVQSICCMPLLTSTSVLGTLNVASKRESGFSTQDQDLLQQVARQLAIAMENARAYREIAQLKDKLAEEKLYLQDEIRTELNFEEIVGDSPSLKRALSQATTVAPSDASVLILGETGTGKELIARAIHHMSTRKEQSFIKLNCAAIPTGLLESELFGHEKGAFTGAITQKVGRLELADKGTLFLDEVGDIPLELQPKLLRVLQDQEFERLGSNHTVKVNIRLLAATNRDLSKLVAERQFRSDLFYRLNVFPLRVPPLRERRKDIPLLVRYFVQRLAHRMNKNIESVPSETMNALLSWDWPGNVRELENFIERSVILTTGPSLKAPLAELRAGEDESAKKDAKLETAERDHILRILRETGGVISGPRGAATRLGLKRTTLQSKMQKLGINRQDYQN
jgi:formate hydrogenlyase transcriptional activator